VKTLDLAHATRPLARYARENAKNTLVLTRKGKPVAALLPLSTDTDMESIALSTNPEFFAIIEKSRAQHRAGLGMSTEEVREALGLAAKPRRMGRSTTSSVRLPVRHRKGR
jgi:PHD/YefM family antitoxin component YafN of YafNO toxin-antitoxin module